MLGPDFRYRGEISKHGDKGKPGYTLLHPGKLMPKTYRTPQHEKRLVRIGQLLQQGKTVEAREYLKRVANMTPSDRKYVAGVLGAAEKAPKKTAAPKKAPAKATPKPKTADAAPKDSTTAPKVDLTDKDKPKKPQDSAQAAPETPDAAPKGSDKAPKDAAPTGGLSARGAQWAKKIAAAKDDDELDDIETAMASEMGDGPETDTLQDLVNAKMREFFERDRDERRLAAPGAGSGAPKKWQKAISEAKDEDELTDLWEEFEAKFVEGSPKYEAIVQEFLTKTKELDLDWFEEDDYEDQEYEPDLTPVDEAPTEEPAALDGAIRKRLLEMKDQADPQSLPWVAQLLSTAFEYPNAANLLSPTQPITWGDSRGHTAAAEVLQAPDGKLTMVVYQDNAKRSYINHIAATDPSYYANASQSHRMERPSYDSWARSIAIHEFGHVAHIHMYTSDPSTPDNVGWNDLLTVLMGSNDIEFDDDTGMATAMSYVPGYKTEGIPKTSNYSRENDAETFAEWFSGWSLGLNYANEQAEESFMSTFREAMRRAANPAGLRQPKGLAKAEKEPLKRFPPPRVESIAEVAAFLEGKKKDAHRPGPRKVDSTMEIEKDGEVTMGGTISKADEERQIVYGWAYVTHDKQGNVVVDKSGEFVDDIVEIEKAAVKFMLDHRATDMHHTNERTGTVVESMVFTPEKIEKMGLPAGSIPLGWWIGTKVDDETWSEYKAGRLKAFSVHGKGTRKAVED